MSCCGKPKQIAKQGLHIVQAYMGLAIEKTFNKEVMKYKHTAARLQICRECKFVWWRNKQRSLWCKLCGCFMPAKARIEAIECPKGKWKHLKAQDKSVERKSNARQ